MSQTKLTEVIDEEWAAVVVGAAMVGTPLAGGLAAALAVRAAGGDAVGKAFCVGMIVWLFVIVPCLAFGWLDRRREAEDLKRRRDADAKRRREEAIARQERASRQRQEEARREQERRAAERRRQEDRDSLEEQARACVCAIARHEDRAREALDQAQSHYAAADWEFRSRRPVTFFHHLEAAMHELDSYRRCVEQIGFAVNGHAQAIENLEQAGESAVARAVPTPSSGVVPLSRDASAERVATNLKDLFNQAQTDIQWAQLYEARRTTDAIQTGFGSLAAAVGRMHVSLEEQNLKLAGTITAANRRLPGRQY